MHTESTSNSTNQTNQSLQSSNLGTKLSNVLHRIRLAFPTQHAIAFLGMDAPELPHPTEFQYALQHATVTNDNAIARAYLHPASDGGYGMLCLPPHAPLDIFRGVRWSDPLTAVSQLKSLTDRGVDVTLGSLMRDVDEPSDLLDLARRLACYSTASNATSAHSKYSTCTTDNDDNDDDDVLLHGPNSLKYGDSSGMERDCPHTFKALLELGLLRKEVCSQDATRESYSVCLERWKHVLSNT